MSDIIKALPPDVSNQIAAGEVIQRPASVVKELLENSIDAGGKSIELLVSQGGGRLIQVTDDGQGMSFNDASLCFTRYATSKLKKAEDLYNIRTMGFRGEALAAIAAVSRVELRTKQENSDLGTYLLIEGGDIKRKERNSCQTGTTLSIKNIFYNFPARKKFLKSSSSEMRRITEEFYRVVLGHPDRGFSLHQDKKLIYKLNPGKVAPRIKQMFGENDSLLPLEETTEFANIKGYVGKPDGAKKTRGSQFLFVNSRHVKSGYIHHAVVQAYEHMIRPGCHPFYVIFLEIDPRFIDVNVHPTKSEIKFEDERLIYGLINTAVKKGLASFNLEPSLNYFNSVDLGVVGGGDSSKPTTSEREYLKFKSLSGINRGQRRKEWEALSESMEQENQTELKQRVDLEVGSTPETFHIFPSSFREGEVREKEPEPLQILGKFLVRQIKSGLVMVDQCAAHERVLYEEYNKGEEGRPRVGQRLLEPIKLVLPATDALLLKELEKEIKSLGFELEHEEDGNVLVHAMPTDLLGKSEKESIEQTIEQFKYHRQSLKAGGNEALWLIMAKRNAYRIGQNLNRDEIASLIDRLFACEQPNFSPSGSPTFIILDLSLITKLFKSP